ncbi:DUF3796 domain-containing protein [Virgibacillus necropolis]|uniref:DUF3796 domain-containing protein n=1 Tax=Virgibacillus necropolis TaxID=163877 RepID=UPI0038508192
MSESFLENPYVILLLLGNFAFMIALYFFQRNIGKKSHRYDERYNKMTNRSKARSWDAMLVILTVAWPVVIIFDGISFSFWLLTVIYVLHSVTWLITNIYVSNQENKN